MLRSISAPTGRDRIIRTASIALVLTLAACNSAPQRQEAGTAAPTATATSIAATATPQPTPEPAATPIAQSTSASASPAAITSCNAEIGSKAATALAQQCRAVSPATRPPCNGANSCAMIRDEIARGCVFLGDDAKPALGCRADAIGAQAAADVVRRYYSAIDAHDYATAYSQWEDDGAASKQSYDAFAKGFTATQKTRVGIGKPGRIEGAAGSSYVTIPVTIDAMLRTGQQQHFTGSYVLRRSNDETGASVEDRRWHLHSASLNKG